MPFTTNLSGTAELDNSLVEAFDQQFLIASAQEAIMDQFVSYKQEIGAKSIALTKYANLALATTALTETDDVASEAMVDSEVILTPSEYGKAVTKTRLASLQSGGKIDLAAARLVGINLGRTLDRLCIIAGDASTNNLTVDGGAEAALDASDVMSVSFLNQIYNKLARASVPSFEGLYVAVMHDDVIHDLRTATSAGSFVDVNKYSSPEKILRNEVGSIGGFRIIRNNHCSINADAGALAVDTYKSLFMGFNALGKVVSQTPNGVLSGPFDKLGRFVNVGWYGVLKYGIVDQDALWTGITTSSVGANV